MSEWERPVVERSTKFATSVETLEEAFAFVMAQLDHVDSLNNIEISGFYSSADNWETKRYNVTISGMTELPAYQPENLT